MNNPVAIVSLASVSPLGSSLEETWQNYLQGTPLFSRRNNDIFLVAQLAGSAQKLVAAIGGEPRYKNLDQSVLMAIAAARKALSIAKWSTGDCGVNIGSSRGATALFEQYHAYFLQHGKAQTVTSPHTTLGNIATWVAQDLMTKGPAISHSITCSTALHALLNGVAWLQAGMCKRFVVGGSEAPLTSFTLAQMQAMKIYSRLQDVYPCRAGDFNKRANSLLLGEAASVACLTLHPASGVLAWIEGVGYATEPLQSSTSISAEATCFQSTMRMALGNHNPDEVDAIVLHAPGTIAGDRAEYRAIQQVFPRMPLLTTNKWICGHTFGASGMLSVELAILMMQYNTFLPLPFFKQEQQRPLRKILVNAVGFGGNAVSVLLAKP